MPLPAIWENARRLFVQAAGIFALERRKKFRIGKKRCIFVAFE